MRWFSVRLRSNAPACLSLLLLALAGCVGGPRRPVPITDHRAYLLSEVPEQFDMTALRGRRIVLDPGHGGPWPGAVGPNGVREADVNLGVALHLWGLLTEAGADVELTRTVDGAVSRLPEPTLKQDLQSRADFTMARAPDIFISLHHNADIIPGSKKNDLETYYQLRGDGPSLDLAQAIHRHLARNTGQRKNAVLPGNFHVIREITVPGILGEASYISSEANEQHLAFAAMQRLEAEAYFLGIVEYFSRGVPRVTSVTPAPAARVSQLDGVTTQFAVDRGVPLDPGMIDVRVDGERLSTVYDPDTHIARATLPRTLASGTYQLQASARNVRGNATRTFRSTFTVDAPPRYVQLDVRPPVLPPGDDEVAMVTARVLDAQGAPVLDGTRVTFVAEAGVLAHPEARTVDGMAVTYWRGGGAPEGIALGAVAGDVSTETAVRVDALARQARLLRVVRATDYAAIPHAQLAVQDTAVVTNHEGMMIVRVVPDSVYRVRAAGFWPETVDGAEITATPVRDIPLMPVAGGALHGKAIAIDAADGGAASGATGPTGVRAADVNLRVAHYLAEYVRTAGGVPVLTRAGDETTSAFERVERSEAAGAARFLSLRHGSAGTPERLLDETGHASSADVSRGLVVEHYPSSVGGKALARRLRDRLVDVLPVRQGRLMQSVAYELTHTACPAVRVQALSPVDPESELLLSRPGAQRRIAYAMFEALAEDYGAEPTEFASLTGRVEDAGGAPVDGATVSVGDLWFAVTDAQGAFRFALLPPGERGVAVQPVDAPRTQRVLRFTAGETLHTTIRVSAAAEAHP